ncbi:MAG TPA: NAD-dependent DNA ligase [Alcanivorax sp.]|jgi:NAD-dependent DNA ligase|uniref:BRCT domain-containing protein n=1 Tax=Alloalcanivorax venustensis TaxID=172371 RepID=UPI000C3DC825|nr:NAD-dependent DNA ligase [Alcanivorax sp.]MBT75400.1 NAD-dependent DNA ligase [Alcanivorax sp.]MCH2553599.1 BRCT domain-containing protein [Alcanivorax sp.]HAD47184.1 NAD-dependent DNA ligase [Alcanivorax sp.]HAI34246.1 NAD-dependent DNA ligase [Alcanivorax sp.]|tara:strand:- start:4111 stop:4719 length:609 start_codon:yes stop_codon:yes gene_type:complete
MDMFTRFNRKAIDDRQIDTLIGLSQGILADGRVNQSEAEFLLNWLVRNRQATTNPIIINLLEKVEVMLEDDILDQEESEELADILRLISGEPSELGELTKTTGLPLDDPLPELTFPGQQFLFTGTCAFGTRKQCQQAIESLGGLNAKSVTKTLNYLVLGTYVTDSWAHENFGRKIEKAMQYRDSGVPLAIISEEHWANAANL